ncbi:hypothetical protein HYV50_02225 [Candidatus Pacearchaeota archaeon]|nr:hypothetical protein [Candidatus Pacearchaeota archaeon]
MKTKHFRINLLLSAFFILLIPLTSATILMGQPRSFYNVGDEFNLTITISSAKDSTDFFIATLVCDEGQGEVELYKSPFSLKKSTEEKIFILTILDKTFVQDLLGNCHVKATYADEQAQTQNFELTNKIDIIINLRGTVFGPGDNVNVFGEAKKINSDLSSGFVEVNLPGLDFSFIGQVKSGQFNFNFTIPETTSPGEYEIVSKVYEKDSSGNMINQGEVKTTIKIKQVTKSMAIALNQQTIYPTQELQYTIIIYDQVGENVPGDASITITSPSGNVLSKSIVKTGQTNFLPIAKNFAPGYWEIFAKLGDFEQKKTFYVEEYEHLSAELKNNTLFITNTGNVPYSGPVEVTIGSKKEILDLENIPVGENKKLRLSAPDGEYEVLIRVNNNLQSLGKTLLTGKVISIDDILQGPTLKSTFLVLLWFVVILTIAIIALLLYRKIQKKKYLGTMPTGGIQSIKTTSTAATASSSVEKGQKQECAVLSLNVRNLNELENEESKEGLHALETALWKAKESGAKIYSEGNYKIAIFASSFLKSQDPTLKAIRIAQDIEKLLEFHNKRFTLKIDYGVGINTGNLIVETKDEKFKFISVDNTIASAKRISEQASSETLLSESLYRRLVGKAKMEKIQNKSLWRLKSVTDRSVHEEFIKKFMHRQGHHSNPAHVHHAPHTQPHGHTHHSQHHHEHKS